MEAMIEIGEFKQPYSNDLLNKLKGSARKISQDVTEQVYGANDEIKTTQLRKTLSSKEFGWLQSDESIREKLHETAKVEMLHINEGEALRQLQLIDDQANQFVDMADKDEQQRKLKEEAVLSFLHKNTNEFDRVKSEIEQPELFQQKDKFTKKFALVFCNENYQNTRLMDQLPAVRDDHKTIKTAIQMLQIP